MLRHTPVKSLETIRLLEITDTEHQTASWFVYQMHTVNLNYITEKAGFCKHTHKFTEKSYVLNTSLCRVCESTHPKFLPFHPQNNYKYYAWSNYKPSQKLKNISAVFMHIENQS